ncbi:tyrosine phosphatase-like protein, partial [Baffinella frigidus]
AQPADPPGISQMVQTLAIMEIFHSGAGLVRAPISRAIPQIFSRIATVWWSMEALYTFPFTPFPKKERNYQFGVMTLGAWCCAELIRYTFYGINTVDARLVPFPVMWLRYTGFIILYPIGVAGEMLCAYHTLPLIQKGLCPTLGGLLPTCSPNAEFLLYLFLVCYLPGLPFLYFAMLGERKKRLYPKAAPKLAGIVFPLTKKGDRSTTTTSREVFACAMDAVDEKAGAKIRKEKNWRFGYARHIVEHLRTAAKSESHALKMAQAGLDKMYSAFDVIAEDGTSMKLKDAMTKSSGTFHTHTIQGKAAKVARKELMVPYKCYHTGVFKELRGQDLKDQVDKWVAYGTIEPDCGTAIKEVVDNPKWTDLTGKHFVLLGATSAMGPFNLLKELGAHIIAVDLDRPGIWKKIIESVENSSATVTFPMRQAFSGQTGDALYSVCGANLMTEFPKIATWLCAALPQVAKGAPVTIGGYAYLDGELHVRVNLACDAIIDSVINMVAGPTLKWLQPNVTKPIVSDDGSKKYLMDGLVLAQGPNYATAKRLQQWRAVLARSQGCTVSINIAPATATASVISNKSFEAAYKGIYVFKPMEVFYQEVSLSVMGALLIYDTSSPNSAANLKNKLANPAEIFFKNAFHGGAARCLYQYTSVGEVAVLVHVASNYGWILLVGALPIVWFVVKAVM